MLDTGPDAERLHGLDVRGRDPPGEKRVLGIALEVAAADRGALEVDDRGEHDMGALTPSLGCDEGSEPADEVAIPGGGDGGRVRQLGRVTQSVVDPPDADRAVRHGDAAQADLGHRMQRPRRRAGQKLHPFRQRNTGKVDFTPGWEVFPL